MATRNYTVSTNNGNVLVYSFSTKLEKRTDRKTSLTAIHGLVSAVNNLGVGVTATNPFTILA